MDEFLKAEWLDDGRFALGTERPSRTALIRDHLAEISDRSLRLVKNPSYGHATNYYLREGDGPGEPQVQYLMAIDPRLPSLVLGLSVEKGEESSRASAGRRMDRRTWDWPALTRMRAATFEVAIETVARATKRPVSIIIWTDREDEDEEWHYTFAWGRWLQRGVPSSASEIVKRLAAVDAMRSRWCDVWIGCELGRSEVGRTTVHEAAVLLNAFSPLRDRLHRKR